MPRTIEFIINKSELAAGTRGASLGPEAIIVAARKKSSNFFGKYTLHELPVRNSALDKPVLTPFAKYIETYSMVFQDVAAATSDILHKGHFPFLLAGDHGSAAGTIAGVKLANPGKRLGVIWIDAHADIHSPYTTPSGNMHGMPVALSLGEDNLEAKRNTLDPATITAWEQLKLHGDVSPKIQPSDVVYVGVRDTESQEDLLIARNRIVNHTVAAIREKGIEDTVKAILSQLSACDIIYISFDVDSMDPELTSYGTGTPVAKGLSPQEATQLLELLTAEPKTVCLELVEVNPCLDNKGNTMAETAFSIVEHITTILNQQP